MAKVFVHIANEDCLDDIVVTSIECDFKPTKGDIIYNCQAELSKIANGNTKNLLMIMKLILAMLYL